MILLTGVNGFIGDHLLKNLRILFPINDIVLLSSKKHDFINTIVYRDGVYSNNDGITERLLSDIEYIIHAGAFTPKSNLFANDIANTNLNITNSTYLFSLPFKNLKKIIYLSTLDVYKIEGEVSENTITLPQSLYGWSKLYAEVVLKRCSNMFGFDYQIFRVGHVYGPGEESYEKIIPITFRRISRQEEIVLFGTGRELRNFIYVEDVIKAILLSLRKKMKNSIINVVGENSISIQNLITTILRITGSKINIKYTNSDFRGIDYVFDNKIFVEDCNPTYTPLEDGLVEEWNKIKTK